MTDNFRYKMTLLSRASFPAKLEGTGGRCIAEVLVYRMNGVAVNSWLLDGAAEAEEAARRFLGMYNDEVYMTRHDIDDILTVVRIVREELPTFSRPPAFRERN